MMTDQMNWGVGCHILCVDDDVTNLSLRTKILIQSGADVTALSDPAVACKCDIKIYDLIIVDFDMPNMDGRQLLLALRGRGAACPMMLLSAGLDQISNESKGLFTVCLAKGQPVQLFLREVRRQLEMSRLEPRC
jgi:CheY-like chemotaxis protein